MAALDGPRLLALRALGLGDLLTAVPALRALADAFPDHRRLLACPPSLAPLVRLIDAVDEIVAASPLRPLPQSLAGVEVAVNLHGRGPQSHRLLQRLEPDRLIAFASPAAGVPRGPRWRADEHEVERWCRLLEESGIAADPGRIGLAPPGGAVDPRLDGATLVHPGAAAVARRWPGYRFAAVARAEADQGRTVLVSGGRGEVELAREVVRRAGLPEASLLAGATDIAQLAAVIGAAGLVVCGDTGVAHLATALGTPSVVLFGPTDPALWGPPGDRPWHRVFWAGRTGDPHAAEADEGLLEIEVDDVLAAAAQARACARR